MYMEVYEFFRLDWMVMNGSLLSIYIQNLMLMMNELVK